MGFLRATAKLPNVAQRRLRAVFSENFRALCYQLPPSGRLIVLWIIGEGLESLLRLFELAFLTLYHSLSHLLLFEFSLFIKRIYDLPEFVIVENFAAFAFKIILGVLQKTIESLVFAL